MESDRSVEALLMVLARWNSTVGETRYADMDSSTGSEADVSLHLGSIVLRHDYPTIQRLQSMLAQVLDSLTGEVAAATRSAAHPAPSLETSFNSPGKRLPMTPERRPAADADCSSRDSKAQTIPERLLGGAILERSLSKLSASLKSGEISLILSGQVLTRVLHSARLIAAF